MPERFNFSTKNPCIHLPGSYTLDLLSILQSNKSNLEKQNRSTLWFSFLMLQLLEKYPGKHIEDNVRNKEGGKTLYGKRMQEFIHENCINRINAGDVARHINLERSYASRIFKNIFNKGIYEYILDFRFQKACDLLMNEYSVKEVCFSCGYSDYANFLKTFKKRSGLSPTEFREKIDKHKPTTKYPQNSPDT